MALATQARAAARYEADRAAERAGVRIVPLHEPDEVQRIPAVVEAVWGPAVSPNPDILRALARAGAVLLAAEPADRPGSPGSPGEPREPGNRGSPGNAVGCALGFLGWDGGLHLHSHQVGVRPERQHTGVGYALKLAQRAACVEHGIAEMRWTFDPLLARNAGFNFGKLGVVGTAFLPDFYGQLHDMINSGDASDRFEVSWRLDTALTSRLDDSSGPELIGVDESGLPTRTGRPAEPGVRVPVPADYAALRNGGDPSARAWRDAARTAFEECFAAGLIATGFGARGYVFGTAAEAGG